MIFAVAKSCLYFLSVATFAVYCRVDVPPGKSLVQENSSPVSMTIKSIVNFKHATSDYNFTMLYVSPPVPEFGNIDYLVSRNFARSDRWICLTDTNKPKHSVNRVVKIGNLTATRSDPEFLTGTTYWLNEYMHVGHALFDSVLIQILKTTAIDRVVMQRAACHANLCFGVGTWRSFWSAYFAAAFEAANQTNIPVYIRWSWTERELKPNFVSNRIEGYEDYNVSNRIEGFKNYNVTPIPKSIVSRPLVCMEHVLRRGPEYWGNFHGSKSPEAVQGFKRAAYSAKSLGTSLPMHFGASSPFVILFSYRGNKGSRHIVNSNWLVNTLISSFSLPSYILRTMNNGDLSNTAEMQLRAMAEANIVITNHGAFEGNVIYMRNASLLIELAGEYYNPEFCLFQHLAHDFGVFYSRIHTSNLQSHAQSYFNITEREVQEIVDVIRDYITLKPYAFNIK